jgi:hypothetical protein
MTHASRREFLQAGIAASLLPFAVAAPGEGAPAGGALPPLYRVLYDERFPESVAYARAAAGRGAVVTGFAGDITEFWYRDLSLRWREEPVAIAGMTTHGPLFCLERWAWDHGLRVVARVEQASAADEGLIAWVIAPVRRA